MTAQPIKTLFAKDIDRGIEEVIKVDQTDDTILRDEIDEYVVTNTIRSHYTAIFEAYRETPNKPHEGIGVWVSGFFGSGKSSFAKMLGLSVEGRKIAGEPAGERLARRANDNRFTVLLNTINEQIPTHAVIFDVLERPWDTQRQSEPDRDHVRALPPEPQLCQGPGPL